MNGRYTRIMDPQEACHLGLKMLHSPLAGCLLSQKSPGPFKECIDFWNRMHRLREEVAEFSKIGGAENRGVGRGECGISLDLNLAQEVEISALRLLERNFRLGEKLQPPGKRTSLLGGTPDRCLHLAMPFGKPDDHQTVFRKTVPPQENGAGNLHEVLVGVLIAALRLPRLQPLNQALLQESIEIHL